MAEKVWFRLEKICFCRKIVGIKVEKNGKNGWGGERCSARSKVAGARMEVGLARVGVGIGRPGAGQFSTVRRHLWRTSGKIGLKSGFRGHFCRVSVPLWRTVCTQPLSPALFAGRNSGSSDVVSCSWGLCYSVVSGAAFFFRGFLPSSCLAVLAFSSF